MKWSLEEKMLASSLGVILLLLGVVSLLSPRNTTELVENAKQVQSTYGVLVNLTDFLAAMSVAESGRRGYIFSGRPEELARHQAAMQGMNAELDQLQTSVNLSPVQQQRVQQLYDLAKQRMALLQQSIALYQRDRSSTAMQIQNSMTDRSVQLRDRIEVLLAEIKDAENQRLMATLEEAQETIQHQSSIERIGLVSSFLVVCGFLVILYWAQKRRQKLQILEQTLSQQQELSYLKLNLFSMISHEFRTPLSVILASSQLLAEILEPKIEQVHLRNLYRIQASAKLLNRLMTDILTITRAEAGKLECQPDWIDIEAFCLNLLDDIQSSYLSNESHHRLNFTSHGRCRRVFLDEKLLYSILSNLVLNAIKYSPDDSEIDIQLSCEPEGIRVAVHDAGMGISQNEQDNIFTPFYRGQNVENISGSGLGLAVVKKCLELHHGHISVASDAGKGTTFAVYIPC